MSIIKKAIVCLCLGAFALAPVGLMAEVSNTSNNQELAWGWGYRYGYSPYNWGGYGYGAGYGYGGYGYGGYGYGCGCCGGGYGYSSWPFFS